MKSPWYIPALSFPEIEEKIAQRPAIILPLASLEPVGACAALGVIETCVRSISSCISERCGILLQPVLSYGNSTGFRSFGGSSGIKKNIYASLLKNIINDSVCWGTGYIFIVNGSFDSNGVIDSVVSSFQKHADKPTTITALNWQRDSFIRSFIARHHDGREAGRSEYGLLSMAAYLRPSLLKTDEGKQRRSVVDEATVIRWKKLGSDPDKFRKLFPWCSTSVSGQQFDPEFGRELYETIVTHFQEKINTVLTI